MSNLLSIFPCSDADSTAPFMNYQQSPADYSVMQEFVGLFVLGCGLWAGIGIYLLQRRLGQRGGLKYWALGSKWKDLLNLLYKIGGCYNLLSVRVLNEVGGLNAGETGDPIWMRWGRLW